MEQTAMGPAERILQTVLTFTDHLHHGRPGIAIPDASRPIGVRWEPATTKQENSTTNVYRLVKQGRKTVRILAGALQLDGSVSSGTTKVGTFREAGLFPEAITWVYRQVAEVWALDNEFAARWASWAFRQDSRDLKALLAAFMLVQSRSGIPIMENGVLLFNDVDYRAVGEAMLLTHDKGIKGLDPKQLLRVRDFLMVPGVAEINRHLGFGRSTRRATMGRWEGAVRAWLNHRENNLPLLQGLVKAGFRKTVMALSAKSGYKPQTPKFFEVLRWKQEQSIYGHRQIGIGAAVTSAESWVDLTESQICERIVATKPDYKRICGMVPKGITRAIMAAAIEAKCLSDKDLVIATPTLEELGLLEVQQVKAAWESACRKADDARAANIAKNVRSKETKETLEQASDDAVKRVVAEVLKGIRIYIVVDTSGSLEGAIVAAKEYIPKFIQALLPSGKTMQDCPVHVSVFNTSGRRVIIPHPSSAGVTKAFEGIRASGGTSYGSGVRALADTKPTPEEDALMIFIGDEEQPTTFESEVMASGINPVAFGLIRILGSQAQQWVARYGVARHESDFDSVRRTATALGIPCFRITPETFDDVYAIPQVIRNLVASTPVGVKAASVKAPARLSLVEQILKTDLLQKPRWAA